MTTRAFIIKSIVADLDRGDPVAVRHTREFLIEEAAEYEAEGEEWKQRLEAWMDLNQ